MMFPVLFPEGFEGDSFGQGVAMVELQPVSRCAAHGRHLSHGFEACRLV